jgi:ATPase subunit of ABC transporter with duplicated ATPase domains
MLQLSAIHLAHAGRTVLRGVDLSVDPGARLALLGVNGSGKTTLLRVAAGLLPADRGAVRRSPGTTVGYLPQDAAVDGSLPVTAYGQHRAGLAELERTLQRLESSMADDPSAADRYVDLCARYDALGGWDFEPRFARALERVGLPADIGQRRLGELSGGQQVRVGLAALLTSRFDIYLLDEPTNNLDLPSLELLEEFVGSAPAGFVLVSHDRRFLDRTASDVVELRDGAAEVYGVPYAEYRRLRAEHLAAASRRCADHQAEVARLHAGISGLGDAAARTRDRKPARDNDKLARHFFAQRSSEQAAGAKRRLEQRLRRLGTVEEPTTPWDLRLRLEAAGRGGEEVLVLDAATRHYDGFRFGPLTTTISHGERVAITGPNGAGKSVLLRLLAGVEQPDAGSVRLGAGVVVGHLDQGGQRPRGSGSGLDVLRRATGLTESEARSLLAKLALGAEHVHRDVDSYSPGERCRLGLAVLMARGATCLVLDEPTNHLDLEAQEELEQALSSFAGTLVVVSHDREMLDAIGVTRHLELAEGRLVVDRPR